MTQCGLVAVLRIHGKLVPQYLGCKYIDSRVFARHRYLTTNLHRVKHRKTVICRETSKVIRLIHLCPLNQDASGKTRVQSEDKPVSTIVLPAEWHTGSADERLSRRRIENWTRVVNIANSRFTKRLVKYLNNYFRYVMYSTTRSNNHPTFTVF